MADTAAMRARLRRMVDEPTTATYDDDALDDYIEAYPVRDSLRNDPDDTDWTASYDLHSAASDIWEEKAGLVWDKFNFSAVGEATYQRSTKYDNCMKQVRYHRARASAKSRTVKVEPEPSSTDWIGNLAEEDD
jgi:hypothetical protein